VANILAVAWDLGFAFSGIGTVPATVIGTGIAVSGIAQGIVCNP